MRGQAVGRQDGQTSRYGVPSVVKKVILAVVVGLVIGTLVDFLLAKDDYLLKYLDTKTGLVSEVGSKADFLVQYQKISEVDTSYVDSVEGLEEINISAELFSQTSVRLNTEIYSVTAEVLNDNLLDQYFGDVSTEIARTAKENVNPLMYICMAAGESGEWNSQRYTWVPAIFSKVMCDVVDMEEVHISEVDSKFYWDLDLRYLFSCRKDTSGHRDDCDSKLHYDEVQGKRGNDADSLGPLQILRRYVTLNTGTESKTVEEVLSGAEYHINIKDSAGQVIYSVTDLMRWEDNVVWAFNNFMTNIRGMRGEYKDWSISNEYELMCMVAIAHNTGAGYLSVGNGPFSSWRDKQAIYDFCKLVGSPESIAYINTEYIEPWYEEVKEKIRSDREWSMPGSLCFEGTGSHKDENMKDILERLGVEFEGRGQYPLNCKYWNRINPGGSDHKFRYPMKTLFNYLALQKLYSSGGE